MTFNYTHATVDIDSAAVYEAYYDGPSRRLAVVLSSGHGYVYNDVPVHVYHGLVGPGSAGKYYAKTVKRGYGPGESLGYLGEGSDEFEKGYEAPSMADVTNINVFTGSAEAKGTPKALTYAEGAVVDNDGALLELVTDGRFTLAAPVGAPTRRHSVVFQHADQTRVHTVNVASVDEAVAALDEIASMLDLDFTVKQVVVNFE